MKLKWISFDEEQPKVGQLILVSDEKGRDVSLAMLYEDKFEFPAGEKKTRTFLDMPGVVGWDRDFEFDPVYWARLPKFNLPVIIKTKAKKGESRNDQARRAIT
jgi:hypothetical protein